jgi:hypothetical protein
LSWRGLSGRRLEMHERAVRVGEGALVDLIVERVVAMMELEGEENESTGATYFSLRHSVFALTFLSCCV